MIRRHPLVPAVLALVALCMVLLTWSSHITTLSYDGRPLSSFFGKETSLLARRALSREPGGDGNDNTAAASDSVPTSPFALLSADGAKQMITAAGIPVSDAVIAGDAALVLLGLARGTDVERLDVIVRPQYLRLVNASALLRDGSVLFDEFRRRDRRFPTSEEVVDRAEWHMDVGGVKVINPTFIYRMAHQLKEVGGSQASYGAAVMSLLEHRQMHEWNITAPLKRLPKPPKKTASKASPHMLVVLSNITHWDGFHLRAAFAIDDITLVQVLSVSVDSVCVASTLSKLRSSVVIPSPQDDLPPPSGRPLQLTAFWLMDASSHFLLRSGGVVNDHVQRRADSIFEVWRADAARAERFMTHTAAQFKTVFELLTRAPVEMFKSKKAFPRKLTYAFDIRGPLCDPRGGATTEDDDAERQPAARHVVTRISGPTRKHVKKTPGASSAASSGGQGARYQTFNTYAPIIKKQRSVSQNAPSSTDTH